MNRRGPRGGWRDYDDDRNDGHNADRYYAVAGVGISLLLAAMLWLLLIYGVRWLFFS